MDERITGVMIYYYFVCKRKLWYFCHDIRMETENEDVMLGKILDESSYKKKDKHVNIDDIINIDFISEHKELHEIKKSKAVEDAGIWQVKYYLYYLQKRGVSGLKGKIDYPLLKKSIIVELSMWKFWNGLLLRLQILNIRRLCRFLVIVNYAKNVLIMIYVLYKLWICIGGKA